MAEPALELPRSAMTESASVPRTVRESSVEPNLIVENTAITAQVDRFAKVEAVAPPIVPISNVEENQTVMFIVVVAAPEIIVMEVNVNPVSPSVEGVQIRVNAALYQV